MDRRSFMGAALSTAATLSLDNAWGMNVAGGGLLAVPVLLVRQTTLPQSRLFAEAWQGEAEFADLGADLGESLLGSKAFDWRSADKPIIGLTTPAALFCIEQTASGMGVRTVARQLHRKPGPDAILDARQNLLQSLALEKSWSPLPPMLDAHGEDDWIYWLMLPRGYSGRAA